MIHSNVVPTYTPFPLEKNTALSFWEGPFRVCLTSYYYYSKHDFTVDIPGTWFMDMKDLQWRCEIKHIEVTFFTLHHIRTSQLYTPHENPDMYSRPGKIDTFSVPSKSRKCVNFSGEKTQPWKMTKIWFKKMVKNDLIIS